MYLKAGESYTVRELLQGLMLVSGNDAAVALALHCSGSVEAFADDMNSIASKLGLENTHFTNPHGLYDEDHYTTVYDLYLIFQAALKNETFREICGSTSYTASYQDSAGKAVSVE